jgi:LysM repeat protein
MRNHKNNRRSRQANIRLARFLVVLSLTTVFGAGFAMQAGAGSKASLEKSQIQSKSYVTITIAPGESLWSIAKSISQSQASQSQNGIDPRQLVDQIMTVNGLTSAQLPAGSQIRVPLN